ncbi:MAG TPA: hypothetical protein PLQ81_14360 [bacterium]|nr:hypothetical protein [bacterium]
MINLSQEQVYYCNEKAFNLVEKNEKKHPKKILLKILNAEFKKIVSFEFLNALSSSASAD